MQQSGGAEPDQMGYGGWIAFWVQLALLVFAVVLGAFFASECREPGDYAAGLILIVASLALAFLRIKARFDAGAPAAAFAALLVDDMANLVAVIVIFTLLGLAGLFVTAGFAQGGLHDSGIAMFLVSGLAVFLSLKHVFDNIDRHPR